MVFIYGKMAENTKGSIKLIKSMGLDNIHGQMEENIMEIGKIVRDTVLVK